VISAAPREVVVSALAGIVPAEHIYGTEFDHDPVSGEVLQLPAARGYGRLRCSRVGAAARIVLIGDLCG